MENIITPEALIENMKVKLQAFNNEKIEITEETIHKAVLSESDGFTSSQSSSKLYKGAIMWTVWANGGKKSRWPADWMDQSVAQLAEFIMSKQTEQ